jgi:Fe-S cluster assembly iron-binding protein IscA
MDNAAPLVTVTDAAREKILEVRAVEPDPDALALWLEVSGAEGATYTYDMYFQRLDEARSDDGVQRHDDVSIVIPQASLDKVRGSTLDLSGAGMVLQNPNNLSPAASPLRSAGGRAAPPSV